MATTIKLKNGSGAPLASDLAQGEPALDLTNRRLYSEDSGGSVVEIGNNPSSFSIAGVAVTSTAAELNILDGVTSTATELNLLDGSTAGTVVNSKAVVYGNSGEVNATSLQVGGSAITATPTEINVLDGISSSTSELNILAGKSFVDEDDMSSDSASAIASQQSIKAYVDAVTVPLTSFVLEDGDGTEVSISNGEEIKFVEGGGIDINWTDTDPGSDADPFDLTFTVNVDTGQIADDAIEAAQIADDAVGAAAIADNSVDIARLNVSDGTSGQALTTDGAGTLSFATIESGMTIDATVKTANFNAVSGKIYKVDLTSSAFTGTLDASPTEGDNVAFRFVNGSKPATNNFTVGRNGSEIENAASDLVWDIDTVLYFELLYTTEDGWIIRL